jgi:photoactive yellow protein
MPSPAIDRICAWCGIPMAAATAPGPGGASHREGRAPERLPPSHGICGTCAAEMGVFPIESLQHYDRARFDDLPFGVIEVDRDGRILLYNRWEEELADRRRTQVLGRLFFSEVAPCTGVAEFEGRFREMVAADQPSREELDFVFQFPGTKRLVNIVLAWAPVWGRGFILVRQSG